MSVIQKGSTPTHRIDTNIDLRDAAAVWVTYQQRGWNIVDAPKDRLTIEADAIYISLTQEETLMFRDSKRDEPVEIQIGYRMPDGTADRSAIISVPVGKVLKEEVI